MNSEESAREVIRLFVEHYKCKPGTILFLYIIREVWRRNGFGFSDLLPGIEYAENRGWIRFFNEGRQTLTITEAGIREYHRESDQQ